MSDLRLRLRRETRPLHDRVDALYGALDLTDRAGYARFLAAHALALEAVERSISRFEPKSDYPKGMSVLARRDLNRLGAGSLGAQGLEPLGASNALGLSYVVAGAHFGLKVLRERWRAGANPVLRSAGDYLQSSRMADYWPKVLHRLAATPSEQASPVVSSANAGFRAFEAAFHAACPQEAPR